MLSPVPTRLLARLLVTVLAFGGAVAGAVAAAPPAAAATCSSADGVSVVADFRGVGGGVESTCLDRDGGGAAELFGAAGHEMTRVQSNMGAVCKVDELPADANCSRMPPANAFWGLFWSDGSGGWNFSQEGVDSLDVPEGGSVAWAWQNGGSSYEYPGVAAPQHASSSPEPSPSESADPSPDGDGSGNGDGHGGGATTSPSGTPTPGPSPSSSPQPSASPGATAELRERARREARQRARVERRAVEERAERQREDARERARERRRDARDANRTDAEAPEQTDPADDRVLADPVGGDPATEAARIPTWAVLLVLLALAGLAVVLVLLRRRAARTD